MGQGVAVAVETERAQQVAKRLRRMTPLERTRFLVRVIPEGEGPPVPGEAVPSFVVVGGDALPPLVYPIYLTDAGIIAARARARFLAGVYAFAEWMTLCGVE